MATRKTIGGMPSLLVKPLLLIALVGPVTGVLSGCASNTDGTNGGQSSESEELDSSLDGSRKSGSSGDGPTYVEVPGTDRRGDVFDFSYTTEAGTEITCVVYDRSGDPGMTYNQGAGGMWCFEEGPDGGAVAPLSRPQR